MIATPAAIAAMPAGPDKAEVMLFHSFLTHHGRIGEGPGHGVCSCGVGATRDADGRIIANPNPDCDCPCHQRGYAVP